MSKTIYLDGTETLVFTRSLVMENYRPNSPLHEWEIMLLQGLIHAALHPDQQVIMEFRHLRDQRMPDKRMFMKVAQEIARALGISRAEVLWNPYRFSIMLPSYGRRTDTNNYSPYISKVYLPPWPITSTP